MKIFDGLLLVLFLLKYVEIVDIEFFKVECDVYEYVFIRVKCIFNVNVEVGIVMKVFISIFVQILCFR